MWETPCQEKTLARNTHSKSLRSGRNTRNSTASLRNERDTTNSNKKLVSHSIIYARTKKDCVVIRIDSDSLPGVRLWVNLQSLQTFRFCLSQSDTNSMQLPFAPWTLNKVPAFLVFDCMCNMYCTVCDRFCAWEHEHRIFSTSPLLLY